MLLKVPCKSLNDPFWILQSFQHRGGKSRGSGEWGSHVPWWPQKPDTPKAGDIYTTVFSRFS